MTFKDQSHFRRQYPRRAFERAIGVLVKGKYGLVDAHEIGEGGLSFTSVDPLPEDQNIVVNLRIPGGDFVSLRAEVKSSVKKGREYLNGVSFTGIQFAHKRQIRSYVSSRETGDVIF